MNKDLQFALAFIGLALVAYLIWDVFANMNEATRGTRESIEELERTRPATP